MKQRGPAAEAFRYMDRGLIDVYLSRSTLRELRAALDYPDVRKKFPGLEDHQIGAFIKRLTYRGILLRRVPHVFDYPRAKQDEAYIDLAAAAKADFLVSRDKDLLSLMTGHSAVCKRFRQITHPLQIVEPVAFLNALRRLA